MPAYLADIEMIWYTIDEYLAFTETQLRFSKSRLGCWLFSDIKQGRKNYGSAKMSADVVDRKHQHRHANLAHTFGWAGINLGKVLKVQDSECERYRFKFDRYINLMSRIDQPGTKFYDSECSMNPQPKKRTSHDHDEGSDVSDTGQSSSSDDERLAHIKEVGKVINAQMFPGATKNRRTHQRTRLGVTKFPNRTVAHITKSSKTGQQPSGLTQKLKLKFTKYRAVLKSRPEGEKTKLALKQLDAFESEDRSGESASTSRSNVGEFENK